MNDSAVLQPPATQSLWATLRGLRLHRSLLFWVALLAPPLLIAGMFLLGPPV
jgi:hypothetical protein